MELVYHFEFRRAIEAKIIASEKHTIQTRGVDRATFIPCSWGVLGAGRDAVSGHAFACAGNSGAGDFARPAGGANRNANRHRDPGRADWPCRDQSDLRANGASVPDCDAKTGSGCRQSDSDAATRRNCGADADAWGNNRACNPVAERHVRHAASNRAPDRRRRGATDVRSRCQYSSDDQHRQHVSA